MHFCLVYPGFPPETHSGGIGTYIFEIINAFKEYSDLKISIISRSDKYINKIEKISSNIILYRIGEDYIGKNFSELLFRNYGSYYFSKRIEYKIEEIEKKHKIDIIEVCDWGGESISFYEKYLGKLVLRCHTPSFISELYNPKNVPYFSDTIKKFEKFLFKKIKYVVSPSKSLIQEIKKYTDIFGEVQIQPYPINVKVIPKKKNYGLNKDKEIKLLTIGRIEERKGQDTVLKIIKILTQRNFNITATFIGVDTPVSKTINTSQLFLKEIGKRYYSKVNFISEMPREKILKAYKDYDLYIAPSRFDNFPFTVLEAMAAGIPVIGFNNSGIAEQIINGKNGLLFNDANDLLNQIIYMIHNHQARRKIGSSGREYVMKRFNPQKISKKILNYYKLIVSKSKYV